MSASDPGRTSTGRERPFSPSISHGAGAGGGVGGELAVEFGKEQHAVGEAKLGAGGRERGVLCGRRPVDDDLAPGSVRNTAVEQGVAVAEAAAAAIGEA